MEIKGKVLSVSHGVADVCIIREGKACGNCSACPKKTGVQDTVQVVAGKGIRVGQEVILRSNKDWFAQNWIMSAVAAFVLGMIVTEAILKVISINIHHTNIDIVGGVILTGVFFCLLWLKKPRYLFRIETKEEEKARYE
ncbi:MAG: hypothetical protein E3K32_08055 [wastewater metagenome]|nr:hypothetical protein [Candidatus Loosdrechtia aerotolerans]